MVCVCDASCIVELTGCDRPILKTYTRNYAQFLHAASAAIDDNYWSCEKCYFYYGWLGLLKVIIIWSFSLLCTKFWRSHGLAGISQVRLHWDTRNRLHTAPDKHTCSRGIPCTFKWTWNQQTRLSQEPVISCASVVCLWFVWYHSWKYSNFTFMVQCLVHVIFILFSWESHDQYFSLSLSLSLVLSLILSMHDCQIPECSQGLLCA